MENFTSQFYVDGYEDAQRGNTPSPPVTSYGSNVSIQEYEAGFKQWLKEVELYGQP